MMEIPAMEEKRKELVGLLKPYEELRASISYVPEQMAITIIVPPPWSAMIEPEALEAQETIRKWSEQYPELVCYCFDSFSTLLYVPK